MELNHEPYTVRAHFSRMRMVFLTPLLISLSAPALSHAQQTVAVTRAHLLCVIEHISVYESLEQDPVLIVLPDCPNPTSAALGLRGLSINSLPTIGTSITRDASSAVTDIVSYTKTQLRCLFRKRDMLLKSGSDPVSVPLNPCK